MSRTIPRRARASIANHSRVWLQAFGDVAAELLQALAAKRRQMRERFHQFLRYSTNVVGRAAEVLQQSGRIDVSSLLTLAAAARTIDAQFTCAACNAVIRTFQAATQGARSRVSGFAQRTVSLVHLVGIARLEVELAVREGDVPPGVQMPTDVAIVNLAHLVVGPSQLLEGQAAPLDLHAEIAASMTVLAASLAQYNPPPERSKPPPAPKLPLMPLPPMLPAVNALLPPETAHAALSVAVALQLLLRGVTNGPAWTDPPLDEAVAGRALAPTPLQPPNRPLLALVRALLRQLDTTAS